MTQPFLSGCYSDEVLQQRQNIILSLLSYALDGIQPTEGSKAETFTTLVHAAMFNLCYPRMSGMPGGVSPGDTTKMVIQAFEIAVKYNNIDSLVVPPFEDTTLTSAFSERFEVVESHQDKVSPSIKGAFDLAKSNLARAQTRQACLAVVSLLLGRRNTLGEYEEIWKELLWQKHKYVRHVMLFGGLLGGEAGNEALKLACHHMVYSPAARFEYSTVEYLSKDGITPREWFAEDEDSFRDEIKKAYAKL